ncbi:MAG: biofilm PGA synthesis N-glycosyltransferase PgaC [Candidatus Marinamargulisbacteria bacterium]|jgi:biofilm PGA synthesis N-glycosyltransferase PgaC
MIKDLLLLFCLSSGYLVFILGLFVHIFEIIQTLTSWASYQKEVDASDVMFEIIKNNHELCPSISILVPAYNESVGIIKTVENLVSLNYPQFDVIVINDGSKDDT